MQQTENEKTLEAELAGVADAVGLVLSKLGEMYLLQRKKTEMDGVCCREACCSDLGEVKARLRAEIKQRKSHRKSIHQFTRKAYTQPCLKCSIPYTPHDRQDKGECPRCRRNSRTKESREKDVVPSRAALAGSVAHERPQDTEPRCDAMNKRQIPPRASAKEEAGPYEWAASETVSPEEFDSDVALKEVAISCEQHGEKTRAKAILKIVGSQGRYK